MTGYDSGVEAVATLAQEMMDGARAAEWQIVERVLGEAAAEVIMEAGARRGRPLPEFRSAAKLIVEAWE